MSPMRIDWGVPLPAPAKLNLFLHVVGRRADGYHLLQTAFRFVDHGDSLTFTPLDGGRVELAESIPGVPDEANLCVRAARLLQAEGGAAHGARIALEKRLPMGGGLGGGSSDAATVLLALNRLWGLNLPRERLQALGLQLGADVPVFVFGQAAFAEGVGEALAPVALPPAWYLVIEPGCAVPTVEIFAAPQLTRDSIPIKIADFSAACLNALRNDMQPVVRLKYPAVAQALDWLESHSGGEVEFARMSGSGACVFAQCASESAARALLAQVPGGWRAWVARGLQDHPLREAAG